MTLEINPLKTQRSSKKIITENGAVGSQSSAD